MSEYGNLKAERPIRFIIAVIVFRAIWWPVSALAIPFALIGMFVDWLSWTAFPAIARWTQPPFGLAYSGALKLGNLILGYRTPTATPADAVEGDQQ